MSEATTPAPGMRALPAGGEAGALWERLALALLTDAQKAALRTLAQSTAYTLSTTGWVSDRVFTPEEGAALLSLEYHGLIETRVGGLPSVFVAYRLTPDGRAVAAALHGEGQP